MFVGFSTFALVALFLSDALQQCITVKTPSGHLKILLGPGVVGHACTACGFN